jgi:nucleotide-binding universal stress UspA family protein
MFKHIVVALDGSECSHEALALAVGLAKEQGARCTINMRGKPDTPLPATLRFVFVMGACFLIGWFVLFLLMKERW